MSNNNLNLWRYDSFLCLTFWDNMHGKDVTYRFHKDGSISKENDDDTTTEVTNNWWNEMHSLMNHIEESYKDE